MEELKTRMIDFAEVHNANWLRNTNISGTSLEDDNGVVCTALQKG